MEINKNSKNDSLERTKFKYAIIDNIALPAFPGMSDGLEERLQSIRNLDTRPDDILLAAFPRSGTHWCWEILNMLNANKAEYTIQCKETMFLEAVSDLELVKNADSPRVLNTHLTYRWLPESFIKNGGKIVHVIRNPKDMLVSRYFFMKDRRKELSELSWKEFFENETTEKVQLYGGWFSYEKEFEEAVNNNKSIYVMYYERLKNNPTEEIKKLAAFLEKTTTNELIEEIAKKCSFRQLKTAHETIKQMTSDAKHYRKGETGDWKNYFTVAQNEYYDNLYASEMSASKLQVTFE